MSVLVFAQHRDGTFRKAAWELLSYGKALALQAGAPLIAVAAGAVAEEELRSLGRYGAAKVIGIPSLEKPSSCWDGFKSELEQPWSVYC